MESRKEKGEWGPTDHGTTGGNPAPAYGTRRSVDCLTPQQPPAGEILLDTPFQRFLFRPVVPCLQIPLDLFQQLIHPWDERFVDNRSDLWNFLSETANWRRC